MGEPHIADDHLRHPPTSRLSIFPSPSLRSSVSRSTSPSSLLASTSSPTSTSVSASPVVVRLLRSTPSARLSPSPSSPTTRSSSMSTPRTCSSRLSSSSTVPSSSPTTAGASPRSSVVRVPGPASRSLTVKGKTVEVVDAENGKRGEISLLSTYTTEMEYIGGGVASSRGGAAALETVLRCLMMHVMALGSAWSTQGTRSHYVPQAWGWRGGISNPLHWRL